ncbi:MAG: type II toxin-antitoxin system Phd/YefM family antitoxin [Gemmatimonadota bacterium]
MRPLNVTEFVRNFADYINRVAYRGERYILVRGGREVASLHPVPEGRALAELPALLAALPRLSPEEAEELTRDLEQARVELADADSRDPWES